MSVNSVTSAQTNYTVSLGETQKTPVNRGTIIPEQKLDSVEISQEAQMPKQASFAKRMGLGFASACVPGIGQIINGEYKKGAIFLTCAIAGLALTIGTMSAIPATALMALEITSALDAARNAK